MIDGALACYPLMMSSDTFTIKQVAETTGISTHTLRYYETLGLIHPIDRAGNTHRRYTQEDINWIQFLLKLRATGMSIQDMQAFAELQRRGDSTLPERIEMLKVFERDVVGRIAEWNDHLSMIRYKIDLYSGRVSKQQACAPDTEALPSAAD